jgi:hypothetical protein
MNLQKKWLLKLSESEARDEEIRLQKYPLKALRVFFLTRQPFVEILTSPLL